MIQRKTTAFFALIAVALAVIGLSALTYNRADASPTAFIDHCKTADATTSLAYMTPGTGTTTLTCPIATDTQYSASGAMLFLQQTASTSEGSAIKGAFEYSMDGRDWYPVSFNPTATTSPNLTLDTPSSFTWKFASSTIGGAAATSTNRNHQVLEVRAPAKFIRVVFSVPVGASNAAIWAQLVGLRDL